VRVIDHSVVQQILATGGQVVDVLPDHEHRSGAIAGAIHLPLPKLMREAQRVLDRARPVVVYCRDCL
jgi:rhodanese-related sulfurtransferase